MVPSPLISKKAFLHTVRTPYAAAVPYKGGVSVCLDLLWEAKAFQLYKWCSGFAPHKHFHLVSTE